MSPLELSLSVLGIVLAIIFAPPVWHAINKGMDALERLRWSGAQYRLGILQNKRHIGFDQWGCGLVPVLRRSPERLKLVTGDRRDDQAY